MLSKEEIEKLLSCDNCKLKECIGCNITYTERKQIREYIEQIEKQRNRLATILSDKEDDKQKLIEKLKEIIDNDEMSDVEYQMKRELALEILEILKGK